MGFDESKWVPCEPTEVMPTAAHTPAMRAFAAAGRTPSADVSYKLVDQRFRNSDACLRIEELMRIGESLPISSPLRTSVAWPCKMLVCNGEWRGYAVPRVSPARSLEELCADVNVLPLLRARLALEMAEMTVGLHQAGVAVGDFDLRAFAFDAKKRCLVLADPGALRALPKGGQAVGRGAACGSSALIDDDVRLAGALQRLLSGTWLSDARPLAGLFGASFSGNALDIPSAAEYAAALQTIVAQGFAQCECGAEFSRAVHGRVCPSCGRKQRENVAAHLRAPADGALQKAETAMLLFAEKARRFATERWAK